MQEMPAHPVRLDERRLVLGEALFELYSRSHIAESTPLCK